MKSTIPTKCHKDEPTTSLHVENIKKLLSMMQKLVNSGNTVVVGHNLDVIKIGKLNKFRLETISRECVAGLG